MADVDNSSEKLELSGPRSPLRVMQIIEALAEAPEGTTLARLAHDLGIPKTSVLNHLRTLVANGYVTAMKSGYIVGPAAFRMGVSIVANSDALSVIRPIIEELSEQSGETTVLGMIDLIAKDVVYVQVLPGRQHIRYSPPVGTRRQLYFSGLGRALLALQSPAFIEDYLENHVLERRTANTITSPAELRTILDQVRTEGLSISSGENIEDLGAIAAPIFDRAGHVQYALGVAVPVTRLSTDKSKLIPMVENAARQASWAFGSPAASEPRDDSRS